MKNILKLTGNFDVIQKDNLPNMVTSPNPNIYWTTENKKKKTFLTLMRFEIAISTVMMLKITTFDTIRNRFVADFSYLFLQKAITSVSK